MEREKDRDTNGTEREDNDVRSVRYVVFPSQLACSGRDGNGRQPIKEWRGKVEVFPYKCVTPEVFPAIKGPSRTHLYTVFRLAGRTAASRYAVQQCNIID